MVSRRICRLSLGGQVEGVGLLLQPAPVLLALAGVVHEPLLPVFADALKGADEEAAGTARRVEEAELERFLRLPAGEQFADGLLDDVVDDVARGVIDAAGFADLRLFLDDAPRPCGRTTLPRKRS